MKCRFCQKELKHIFVDLVNSPPSNSFLKKEELDMPETYYPLKLYVCHHCFLVQIDEYKKSKEIFNQNYAYFSSVSKTWLKHCREYVETISQRLNLSNKSQVIEIASNDGGLLQYFKKKNISVLGVEPTENTAQVAQKKGIPTLTKFFGSKLATQLKRQKMADLIIGNNVLAHVPDVNDFVQGIKIILKDKGVTTLEFPHLMQLIEQNQFDTIYHEHFSYFSFFTVRKIFNAHRLELFDVEEIPTHGGSLRIYAGHKEDKTKKVSPNVDQLIKKEISKGMNRLNYYRDFQTKIDNVKNDLMKFLFENQKNNKKVVAYGAAAKGNTLLNYCGIKKDLIRFVVDKSPEKQGKFLPGSHIPIVKESEIKKFKPDYILILPWNIQEEIIEQLKYARAWGGKFVLAIPKLKII